MGRVGLGRWVVMGLALVVLGGCDPDPPVPRSDPTAPVTDVGGTREELYRYCEQATGRDPKCWSDQYGNNLRALEHSLLAPDEFGGQTRQEVEGAQGLGTAARVGIDVEMVSSTLVGIDFTTVDENSAGVCRTAFDSKAQMGVVTVMTDGPLGPREIVQAYIIGNPVFRIGRSLSEAQAGLGAPGIGVSSSLADLQATYPGLEVVPRQGGKAAITPVEQAREQLATATTDRRMVFLLGDDDRVEKWMVGAPPYAGNLCN